MQILNLTKILNTRKLEHNEKDSMLITNKKACKIVETGEKLCLGVTIIKNRRPVTHSIGTGSQASYAANHPKKHDKSCGKTKSHFTLYSY